MATSPPYHTPSALSPPYPSNSQLPPLNTLNVGKKRSAAGDGASPALKRRKGSVLSVASSTLSAHPLRQTSFPPDESPFDVGSPSLNDDNASMISGSGISSAPVKKKRGRKSKAEKAREQNAFAATAKAPASVSGASAAGEKSTAGADAGADDDDDLVVTMGVANAERTAEEKEEEKKHTRILTMQMDKEQVERYELFRASRFSDAVVKRVVNAAVSQSVPANVTAAVKSAAKVFVGDLLESARRIQCEWMVNTGEKQSELPEPEWPYEEDEHYDAEPIPGKHKKNPYVKRKEPMRGPFRPDHIREAWRRYKQSVEGGAVGTLGLWHVQQHSGVDRFGARVGGKRLFK